MSSRPPWWFDKNPLAQATTLPLPPFFGPWEPPGAGGTRSSLKLDFLLLWACAFLATGF